MLTAAQNASAVALSTAPSTQTAPQPAHANVAVDAIEPAALPTE
jgi:hypothetical protein